MTIAHADVRPPSSITRCFAAAKSRKLRDRARNDRTDRTPCAWHCIMKSVPSSIPKILRHCENAAFSPSSRAFVSVWWTNATCERLLHSIRITYANSACILGVGVMCFALSQDYPGRFAHCLVPPIPPFSPVFTSWIFSFPTHRNAWSLSIRYDLQTRIRAFIIMT